MSITATTTDLRDGRSLLEPELFDRLERRIRAEHPDLTNDMPGRILDQALAFLGAAAATTAPIGPSEIVDIGWHTFLLYTVNYAAFCERLTGRFIHHIPNEDDNAIERGDDGMLNIADCETGKCKCTAPGAAERGGLKATVRAMRLAGFRVDADLWPTGAVSDCSQCHQGCHDSPGK